MRETSVCGCLSRGPHRGPDPQARHVLGIEWGPFGLQAAPNPPVRALSVVF